ncbi:ABC transporter permease [Phyllobacterium sp. 0TCS1.6C]|uniref:ABC transporter permease n=1 Tax=unclassified Phyllobacterium TaxID=2638441 RepID=UPI002264CB25|nr:MULTISPECIES: ABC transporter permease [unclassified Phyllobacterium]MCX8282066.1 ABC transporter permease [Phyllobacterium sp. 0TCS1.6C]MCX8296242.1 ABC transporter permease [Phyllobacterium sp. 0TCS1.6A]
MTLTDRIATVASWIVALAVCIYLLTPLIITVIVSFTSSSVYTLPPPGWSLRWYETMARKHDLINALWLSVNLASISTIIALVVGTLASLAIVRGRFPGREILATVTVSPLMMPGLVIGVALLQFFRDLGLRDAYWSLLLAHIVITLPYIVRTLVAALEKFDFSLIDAAQTLGLPYSRAIIKVMVPGLAPAFLTSGMFAFLASMDNYPISIFLTDAWNKTLPIKMLQYLEEAPDPTIAAVSSGLIVLALTALVIGSRTVGLNRMIQ